MNIDLTVTRVVQSGPATVVFFGDGTKSVTKCRLGDEFDPTLGVAWALCKRIAKENGRSVLDFVPTPTSQTRPRRLSLHTSAMAQMS